MERFDFGYGLLLQVHGGCSRSREDRSLQERAAQPLGQTTAPGNPCKLGCPDPIRWWMIRWKIGCCLSIGYLICSFYDQRFVFQAYYSK